MFATKTNNVIDVEIEMGQQFLILTKANPNENWIWK